MRTLRDVGGGLIVALVVLVASVWPEVPENLPVGPTDPVCLQVIAERPPDLILVNDLAAIFDPASIPDVAFGQLPARDGSVVRLTGFIVGDMIFPSREVAMASYQAHGLYLGIARTFPQTPYWRTRGAAVTDRCARVEGRIAWGGDPDHNLEAGRFSDLLRVEVWSEPERRITWNPPPPPADP